MQPNPLYILKLMELVAKKLLKLLRVINVVQALLLWIEGLRFFMLK